MLFFAAMHELSTICNKSARRRCCLKLGRQGSHEDVQASKNKARTQRRGLCGRQPWHSKRPSDPKITRPKRPVRQTLSELFFGPEGPRVIAARGEWKRYRLRTKWGKRANHSASIAQWRLTHCLDDHVAILLQALGVHARLR